MRTGLHGRCTEVRADHTVVPSPTNIVTLTAVPSNQGARVTVILMCGGQLQVCAPIGALQTCNRPVQPKLQSPATALQSSCNRLQSSTCNRLAIVLLSEPTIAGGNLGLEPAIFAHQVAHSIAVDAHPLGGHKVGTGSSEVA